MTSDVTRLRTWLRRAAPKPRELIVSLVSGFVAALTNLALLIGAVDLLAVSSTRPGLRAVAGALIVIELFAFLRSPLRFAERMSSHRLGFSAVSRWRAWLLRTIGALPFRSWRRYAAGDLLERALRDTDDLQDLWLRAVIPAATTFAVMLTGDLALALLPPRVRWWPIAGQVLVAQILGAIALVGFRRVELRDDRTLRLARSHYRAAVVELSHAAPALDLLGAGGLVTERLRVRASALATAERRVDRRRWWPNVIVAGATLLALSSLLRAPASAPVWTITAALLGLATADYLDVVQRSLRTAIAVTAGAERLDALARPTVHGSAPWPPTWALRVRGLAISEETGTLARQVDLDVAPGQRVALVGASGAGKSSLLRVLARLDEPDDGTITIGDVPLRAIDEGALREHLAYVGSDVGLLRGYRRDVLTLGRSAARDGYADLERLGLETTPSAFIDHLSRGEAARFALARALLIEPAILLLDEPTSGLGHTETAAMLALLNETSATVLVATHDPDVVAWCDQVYTLADGAVSLNR